MAAESVLIDTNDAPHVNLAAFGQIPVNVAPLDHGDAMIACTDGELLAVERKTPSDLLASIADGRLFTQIAGMSAVTPWCYVVVTGDLEHRGVTVVNQAKGLTGWNWSAVQGALLDVQEMGGKVVFAAGEDDYELCLLRLAARDHGKTIVRPARPPRVLTVWEWVLCSVKGIGPKTAFELLSRYPTPAWALTEITNGGARRDKLVDLGQERNARSALGLKDGLALGIIPIEDEGNGHHGE